MKTMMLMTTALALLLGSGAGARTWYVEKDGTGDFTSPQSAAEAAADGDTIRIGAGRFEDFVVDTPTGILGIMAPLVPNITILGAGTDSTILGPEVYPDNEFIYRGGVFVVQQFGSESATIEGITFEHLKGPAVLAEYGEYIAIRNCRFVGCETAAVINQHVAFLEDCSLVAESNRTTHFFDTYGGNDVRSMTVRRCSVDLSEGGCTWGSINFGLLGDFLMEDCLVTGIKGGFLGQGDWGNGTFTIRNCAFFAHDSWGYNIAWCIAIGWLFGDSPTTHIENCHFSGFCYPIRYESHGFANLEVENCIFENSYWYTVIYEDKITGYIHNSELSAGLGGVIGTYEDLPLSEAMRDTLPESWGTPIASEDGATRESRQSRSSDDVVIFDMTENWWGTTDPDSIQTLIFDRQDDPEREVDVLWLPYLQHEVGTKKQTLGGIRSLYR